MPWARLSAVVVVATLAGAVSACSSGPSAPQGSATQLLEDGLSAQHDGNLDLALADYQAVLSKEPSDVDAIFDVGTIYQARSQNSQAATWYERALKLQPNLSQALYNLAIIDTSSNPTEAVSLYQEDITVDASNASAWFNLGVILYRQGQQTDGRADIKHAISLNPALSSYVPSDINLS